MDFKKRIHKKMMFNFLGTSLLVYIISLGYVGFEVKDISKEMAHTDIIQKTDDLSNKIKGQIKSKEKIAELLANTMRKYENIDNETRCQFYTKILQNVIGESNDIVSIWTMWEPGTLITNDEDNIDEDESSDEQKFVVAFYRQGDEIKTMQTDSIPLIEQCYSATRDAMNTCISDPRPNNENIFDNSALIASATAPIIVWDEFVGAIGIDFSLNFLQDSISKFQNNSNQQLYLISSNGDYIYNNDHSLVGEHQTILEMDIDSLPKDSVFIGSDINKKQAIIDFKKIDIANKQWCLITTLPTKTAYVQANKSFVNVIMLILAGFILLSIVISIVAKNISNAIVLINNKLAGLSLGIINKSDKEHSLIQNEITDLTNSLDHLFDSLQASVDFAGEIGKGNLDTEYKLLSDSDTLGESLITMQKSLIQAKDEENKKKLLDDQRNWVTHGLAKFGEIIRQDNDNVEDFAFNLLSQLLKYVDIVQGAIYFKVDDQYGDSLKFENKAAIAYGKQIMLDTTITEQDGIFGRVITEQKYIYLEDIPETYVSFTQGKKEKQKPRNLLVIPMVVNDEIFGIMELISYNHIEKYQIDFVEKLCENIASVISSVNTNIHNAKLLEQSNEQAEELSQHEEEMRQNLEEMQATQEEATKRHNTLNSQIMAFYNGLMVAEIDLDGNIINMSKKMMNFYEMSNNNDQVQGSSYIAVVSQDDSARDSYKGFWNELLEKGKAQRSQITLIRNKELLTQEYYRVVYINDNPDRIVVISINRNREQELNERLMIEIQSYMQEHGMSMEE